MSTTCPAHPTETDAPDTAPTGVTRLPLALVPHSGGRGLFMMPLEGPEKGRLRQFLSVPVGAETCGPVITFDERAILVAVQHPGEVDGATAEKPASRFPYRGDKGPRPSVIQAYRA